MEFKHFRGPAFRIDVPTDWFVGATPQFQAIFQAPVVRQGIQPNLTVAVRPVKPEVVATAVAAQTRDVQEKEYPGYQVLTEYDYTPEGGIAVQRLYQWQQNGVGILQLQVFVVVAQLLYTLTATRPADDDPDLDAVFAQMVQSFQPQLPLVRPD
ncbi:MAG TPA: DcrB-related protein [Aggregatilineaceae bacterium]|nr:DcrB-related protein [Aggregatilineaceae bacterium]